MYYTFTHVHTYVYMVCRLMCTHKAKMWDMLTHILVARLKLLYKQMQGLLDVYSAFFSHRWRFQLLRLETWKKKRMTKSERLDWMCLVIRGLLRNRTHQIHEPPDRCTQHRPHRLRRRDGRWTRSLCSGPDAAGGPVRTHADIWLTTELCVCSGCFFFVGMYGFNLF